MYEEIGTFTPDKLIAGNDIPLLTKSVTLLAGQGALARGTVLGLITKAVGDAVAGEGNTGDGAVASITMGKKAQIGSYKLTCVGAAAGAKTATAAAGGTNTGDGAITEVTPGDAALVGEYVITCITAPTEASANDAVFSVTTPYEEKLVDATQGVAYVSDHINFTIGNADQADFIVGDSFTVTVVISEGGNNAAFSVKTPNGEQLVQATQGVAYTSDHLNFTIGDASEADFVAGDTFIITVSAATEKAKTVNTSNVDGSQDADCILADSITVGDEDVVVEAYRMGLFNRQALTFGGTDTAANHESTLRSKGIILKDNISY